MSGRKRGKYLSLSLLIAPNPKDEYPEAQETLLRANEILLHKLRSNIRFCERYGKALPLYHRGRLCDTCFQRNRKRAAQGT